jgi:superfamily II DNA or RNA helicase
MSIVLDLESIDYKVRERIDRELRFQPETAKGKYGKNKYKPKGGGSVITPYHVDEKDRVFLPFSYALKTVPKISRPTRDTYAAIAVDFVQQLRKGQKEVKSEILQAINTTGSVILSFYPGFGKTSLAIYISTKIRLRTLIIVHRLVLLEQWVESIRKFCPDATYSVITSKYSPKDLEADFLLVNAINVEKIGYEAFKTVGNLVVDEIHTIATETLSRSLYHVAPRYLIGLSATPTRPDGMDVLLQVYFGERQITRQLYRKHTVYRIDTGLEPEVRLTNSGTVDWGSVIEFQSNDNGRNEMIVDIVLSHKSRHFLVLCKRVSQAQYLQKRLIESGETVTSLVGSETQYDRDARVVIATVQKCGVGFSHDILDALILAADVEEYFIQYLGRVMRTEEVEPVVFDLVDNNSILKRHFSTRKHVYLSAGGSVKKYEKLN